jgi:fermentation-respiration switch protein FrsA (DUF1100 family)
MVGSWRGILTPANGSTLHLVFTIVSDPHGYLTGTLISADQSPQPIPFQAAYADGIVDIKVSAVGGSFHGRMHGDTIKGAWTQSGAVIPLNLTRSANAYAPPVRPQNPKPPFPYTASSVTFPGEAANVVLAGTLTVPPGVGPFPAVILIAGSGPNDRDETVFGHRPFLVLADYLTRRGVAVLRYDKRGIGKSSGDYIDATTADFARDATAAVTYLKSITDINSARIGLIGHSEGGIIAPLCASSSSDVAFIVLMAGTGVRGDKLLERQMSQIGGMEAGNSKSLQATVKFVSTEYEVLTDPRHEDDATVVLADKAKESGLSPKSAMILLSPWFRYMMTYDPRSALLNVKCPVLAIGGSKDLQVDPDQNLPAIESALKEGGNKDYTVKELTGLNHLFQPAVTGLPTEYAKIDTTIDPSALELIGDWVVDHTKG